MKRYNKVIFVCEDNTCRSPIAEAVFSHALCRYAGNEHGVEIVSRGRVVLFPEPYNRNVPVLLQKNQIRFRDGESAPFVLDEVFEDTLVITMTMQQKIKLTEDYGIYENLFTMRELVGEEGDITDPYGAGEEEYQKCLVEMRQILEPFAEAFAEKRKETGGI